MGNFKPGGEKRFGGGGFDRRDGSRPNFSKKNWGGSGGRDRGPVTMHKATCDQCGKPCEVPFRPTEGKPVYCNVCFGGRRDAENNRGGGKFPQKDFNSYKSPVVAGTENTVTKGNNDDVKKQLEILNVKMDQLIKVAEMIASAKPAATKEKIKKTIKQVPAVKVKESVKIKKIAKKVSKK